MRTISRRFWMISIQRVVWFCIAIAAVFSAAGFAAEKPNIIFILSDDYGIGGMSCYGADKYKTPELDKLAAGALRFELCFSAPLCGPSRAMCMTGKYGFRTGATHNNTAGRAHPDKDGSIAKLLQQAGYATAVSGKWRQLSHFKTKEDARKWGFDEFLIWGIPVNGSTSDERYWSPNYNLNGKPLAGTEGKYGPDLQHDYVVDFITRHRDQPFFVYYPMQLIHGPILRTPDSGPNEANYFADNISYMDKLVGKLVSELDRLGLREKTVLVFTGDNGCTERASGSPRSGGSIGGRLIEGDKGTLFEGGSRVPLIVDWKGKTPQGKVLNDLVDFTDFFPTFAELAGATLPKESPIDGHSFAAQLRGEKGQPRESVYVQLEENYYVRSHDWKLDNHGQLFDMHDAPHQQVLIEKGKESDAAKAARAKLAATIVRIRGTAQDENPKARAAGR